MILDVKLTTSDATLNAYRKFSYQL